MYDVIIIGGGPAGLTAAIYAGRAELRAVVAEKDYMGAGQIAVSEMVDNYPAIPEINGFELGQKFREHASRSGSEFYQGEVSKIIPENGIFTVEFADGKSLNAKTIVYAAGTSYRRLNVSGNELLGVSYCAVCDGMFYKGKAVSVVGGGDTALGDAMHLSRIAQKVYLIHRRTEFRANKALQQKVKNAPNIELVLDAEPVEIIGKKRVEGIEIVQSGQKRQLDVSGVFTAIGSVPNSKLLENITALDKNGYIIAGENGVTSAKGIFAAGDVRTKSVRQVVTAAADGANCIESIEMYLL